MVARKYVLRRRKDGNDLSADAFVTGSVAGTSKNRCITGNTSLSHLSNNLYQYQSWETVFVVRFLYSKCERPGAQSFNRSNKLRDVILIYFVNGEWCGFLVEYFK